MNQFTQLTSFLIKMMFKEDENMLFDVFDKAKPYYVRIGLEFYNRISLLSNEELEAADFSVEEIGMGIKDMLDFYGVKIAVKRAPAPAQNDANVAPNVMADPPKGGRV